MANFAARTIPLEKIRRICIAVTKCKKTLAQIKADTGADYVLNGTLYNLKSGALNCWLKVDGEVLKDAGYNVLGYAWDTGPDILMENVKISQKANFIACTPLIADGKKIAPLTYDPGQGGQRGRSAIGLKDGRLALYCTRDASGAARTPEALRDDLFLAQWDSAIMLDGGTSSQCDFCGTVVQSLDNRGGARSVQHWICVWLTENNPVSALTDNDRKREKVLYTAAAEVGVTESPAGSNKVKYNDWYYAREVSGSAYPWCMAFVQWVFSQAELPLPVKTAGCTVLANYARAHGQWVKNGFKPGDILFMHWNKSASATEHVGIVEHVHSTYVTTIEGNTSLTSQDNGGAVMRRNRAYGNITGAYRPWYNM